MTAIVSLGTFVGAVAWGLLRPLYVHFYSQLGLRLEDVGLTSASVVSLAGSMTVRLLAPFVVLLAAVAVLGAVVSAFVPRVVPVRWMRRAREGFQTVFGTAPSWLLSLVGALVATAVVLWPITGLVAVVQTEGIPEPFAKIVYLGFAVVTGCVCALVFVRHRAARVSFLGVLLVVGLVLLTNQMSYLYQEAGKFGERAMTGGDLSESDINQVMGVFNGPAQVTPVKKEDPLDLCTGEQYVFPLGSEGAGEWVVLWREGKRSRVVLLDRDDYRVLRVEDVSPGKQCVCVPGQR